MERFIASENLFFISIERLRGRFRPCLVDPSSGLLHMLFWKAVFANGATERVRRRFSMGPRPCREPLQDLRAMACAKRRIVSTICASRD